MTRWRFALVTVILVAAGGLGLWARFSAPGGQGAELEPTEENHIPGNRERSVIRVADGHYSPPDATTRRRFDGRWRGVSDAGSVFVMLLDGVGNLIIGDGEDRTVGRFEILQYFGDDLIDVRVWLGEDNDWMCFARLSNGPDLIRLEGLHAPGPEGLPSAPFVLRRDRSVGESGIDWEALSKANPVHPPWLESGEGRTRASDAEEPDSMSPSVPWRALDRIRIGRTWESDAPDEEIVGAVLSSLADRVEWHARFRKAPAGSPPEAWTIGQDYAFLLSLLWQQFPGRRGERARVSALEKVLVAPATDEEKRRWASLALAMATPDREESVATLKNEYAWFSQHSPVLRVVLEAIRSKPPMALLPVYLASLRDRWRIEEEFTNPPHAVTSTRVVHPVARAARDCLAELGVAVTTSNQPDVSQLKGLLILRLLDSDPAVWVPAAEATRDLERVCPELGEFASAIAAVLPDHKRSRLTRGAR
jgi:hypothetical protein